MNKLDAKEEILKLSEAINHHNHLYYVESNPVISDYDFDMLLKRLQELEQQFPEFAFDFSPTKRVGGDITKKFETVVHRFPMLSLSNTYSEEEIQEFYTYLKKWEILEYVKSGRVAVGKTEKGLVEFLPEEGNWEIV